MQMFSTAPESMVKIGRGQEEEKEAAGCLLTSGRSSLAPLEGTQLGHQCPIGVSHY